MNNKERLAATEKFDNFRQHEAAPCVSAPSHIGRYQVEGLLGEGGFGLVWLGYDAQLYRRVAIKVPHPRLVASAADAELYLTEARTVANLDHPNIVPVHDVGSADLFPCYVVSKYVDGVDLASRLGQSQIPVDEVVDLVAVVAEALHYAHCRGLVHRDVKPGNILLDRNGKPFVADFGLALRDDAIGTGPRYAGTPAYMSPEQARGEGDYVDGRSDVFSLGAVLYELLTNKRPFRGTSREELFNQITRVEARPPRQIDDSIPKELERICLKALAKPLAERYLTAKDMADDLRRFQAARTRNDRPLAAGQTSETSDHGGRASAPHLPATRRRHWTRLIGGLVWLFVVSRAVRHLTGFSTAASYAATLGGTLFTLVLALAWMADLAKNGRKPWQFSLKLALLGTSAIALFAAFFSAAASRQVAVFHGASTWYQTMTLAVLCVAVGLLAVPPALYISEPLLWFAAWLVRWPPAVTVMQSFVRRWRRNAGRRGGQQAAIRWQFNLRRIMESVALFCVSAAIVAAQSRPGAMNLVAVAAAILAFWAGVFNFFGRAALLLGTFLLMVVLSLFLGVAFFTGV